MCETRTEDPGARTEERPEAAEERGGMSCPCESKRCRRVAVAVLAAAVAVPLVMGALRRARSAEPGKRRGSAAAGCCG